MTATATATLQAMNSRRAESGERKKSLPATHSLSVGRCAVGDLQTPSPAFHVPSLAWPELAACFAGSSQNRQLKA